MSIGGVDLPKKPDISLFGNNIVICDLTGFRHLSVDLVRYIHNERMRQTNRKQHAVLLLVPDLLTLDFEAQIFASRPDLQQWTEAMAVVGDSFMLRHLVSMYASYHAPGYPLELFTKEELALEWLQPLAGKSNLG